MPETKILLVRHADVHNPDQIVYGRLPRFRLSKLGEAQAEATAEFLSKEDVKYIYTSPMLRARQTAKAIAKYHPEAKLRISKLLAEINTSWQGTPWSQIGANANLYEPIKDPENETIEDVAKRMLRIIRTLVRRHPGETVICVSHADPIKIAWVALEGKELTFENIRKPPYPDRASVTTVTFNDDHVVSIKYENPAIGVRVTPEQESEKKPSRKKVPVSV